VHVGIDMMHGEIAFQFYTMSLFQKIWAFLIRVFFFLHLYIFLPLPLHFFKVPKLALLFLFEKAPL